MYEFFRRWRDNALVKEFHDRLRARVREELGRDAQPTAGVIDSQSVKADAVVGADSRGFDGGKLINGRKRHVVVDTLSLLLGVMVTAADTGDRTAAQVLLRQVTDAHHRLELVWADGGYTGSLVVYCLATFTLVLAIVKRSDDMRGFVVLPKRWIVECLFARLMRSRRLVRDFEHRTTSAEACLHRHGFTYWEAERPSLEKGRTLGSGADDVAWAGKHGYGSRIAAKVDRARLTNPNLGYRKGLSEERRKAYDEALDVGIDAPELPDQRRQGPGDRAAGRGVLPPRRLLRHDARRPPRRLRPRCLSGRLQRRPRQLDHRRTRGHPCRRRHGPGHRSQGRLRDDDALHPRR
jgi:transposase